MYIEEYSINKPLDENSCLVQASLFSHSIFSCFALPIHIFLIEETSFKLISSQFFVKYYENILKSFVGIGLGIAHGQSYSTRLSAWGVAGLCLGCPDFASNLSTFLVWTVMLSSGGILSKDVLFCFSKLHSAKFKEVFFRGRESVLLVSFSYQLLEFSFLLSFFSSDLESKFLQLNASFWYWEIDLHFKLRNF